MGERGEDDQDELETVHLLATDDIRKVTEPKLTDDSTTRCSDFDSSVRVLWDDTTSLGRKRSILPVDIAEHGSHHTDSKDVVGIGEEANTGHDDSADMVPAERSLVDFCESETTALVGVGDVSIVVVEVVEGSYDAVISSQSWYRGS